MKLPITCSQCMIDDVASANIIATVEFRDDGRYEIKCPKGHISTTLLQQQKFEILFNIGAYAVIDGYYREAVSSFTSALERFYEFFIKVICISRGIEWETITDCWKSVSNQSERQVGAFIFLYFQEFGKKPPLLSNSNVRFRNEVIHKGKIPNRDQAVSYGQAILDAIRPTISILKKKYGEAVRKATFHHLNEARTPSDDGRAVSTMFIPTIIGLTIGEPNHDEKDLETAIGELKRH